MLSSGDHPTMGETGGMIARVGDQKSLSSRAITICRGVWRTTKTLPAASYALWLLQPNDPMPTCFPMTSNRFQPRSKTPTQVLDRSLWPL